MIDVAMWVTRNEFCTVARLGDLKENWFLLFSKLTLNTLTNSCSVQPATFRGPNGRWPPPVVYRLLRRRRLGGSAPARGNLAGAMTTRSRAPRCLTAFSKSHLPLPPELSVRRMCPAVSLGGMGRAFPRRQGGAAPLRVRQVGRRPRCCQ